MLRSRLCRGAVARRLGSIATLFSVRKIGRSAQALCLSESHWCSFSNRCTTCQHIGTRHAPQRKWISRGHRLPPWWRRESRPHRALLFPLTAALARLHPVLPGPHAASFWIGTDFTTLASWAAAIAPWSAGPMVAQTSWLIVIT